MKQFYEIYNGNTKLSTLLREISWSHNLAIMSRCDTDEEREFYVRLTIKEKLSFRELERQINTSSFERVMIADEWLSPAVKTIVKDKDDSLTPFKDTYIFDFLDDLPKQHKEKELKQALINVLKEFILELGRDFSFVGQNYKIEVGKYSLNRSLSPTVILDYKTKLIPKNILQEKLHELKALFESQDDN